MIHLQNVSKIYKPKHASRGWDETVYALRAIDVSIAPGEFVSIVGASGSGKSTLMHILGLLDRPTTGHYLLDGENTDRLSNAALARLRGSAIGFVFQHFQLFEDKSALENVETPLMLAGVSATERRKQAEAVLEAVGLADRRMHTPMQLSGGQQQRVAIARALVTNPPLILADEPTGNLDPRSANEILDLLGVLHDGGKTVILITHDMRAAVRAQRMLQLEAGSMVEM